MKLYAVLFFVFIFLFVQQKHDKIHITVSTMKCVCSLEQPGFRNARGCRPVGEDPLELRVASPLASTVLDGPCLKWVGFTNSVQIILTITFVTIFVISYFFLLLFILFLLSCQCIFWEITMLLMFSSETKLKRPCRDKAA